jgi:hypothetical protein
MFFQSNVGEDAIVEDVEGIYAASARGMNHCAHCWCHAVCNSSILAV